MTKSAGKMTAVMAADRAPDTPASTPGKRTLVEAEQERMAVARHAAYDNARANVRGSHASQVALAVQDSAAAVAKLRKRAQDIAHDLLTTAQGEITALETTTILSAKAIDTDGKALRGQIATMSDPDVAKKEVMAAVVTTDNDTIERLYDVLQQNRTALSTSSMELVEKVNAKALELETSIQAAGKAVVANIDQMAQSQLEAIALAEHGTRSGEAPMIETILAEAFDGFASECNRLRIDARTCYADALTRMQADTQLPIETAKTTWRQKTMEAHAAIQSYETEAIKKHQALPSELTRSTARKIWDGVKAGLATFGKDILRFVAAVLLVALAITMFLGAAVAGTAVAVGVVLVGVVLVTISILTNFAVRLQQLRHNQWPWYVKIIGIPAALGVGIADTLGLSRIAEGARGRQLITDQKLTTEDRATAVTEGTLQLVTLGVAGRRAAKSTDAGATPGPVPAPAPTAAPTPAPADGVPTVDLAGVDTARSFDTGRYGKEAAARSASPRSFGDEIASRIGQCIYEGEDDVYHLAVDKKFHEVKIEKRASMPKGWRTSWLTTRINTHGVPPSQYADFIIQQMALIRDYYSHKPGTEVPTPEGSAAAIYRPVAGLFDSIPRDKNLGQWAFRDKIEKGGDGTMHGETMAMHVDGAGVLTAGRVGHSYNPATGELGLLAAFRGDLPSWVNEPGIPAFIEGKGIPTGQFLTLRLMKLLGISFGDAKQVRLSMIQNVKSILQFNRALLDGMTPEQAIMQTEIFSWSRTILAQAGRSITNVRIGLRERSPFDYNYYETATSGDGFPETARIASHNRLIEQYGGGKIKRDTAVEWNFDVELTTAQVGEP